MGQPAQGASQTSPEQQPTGDPTAARFKIDRTDSRYSIFPIALFVSQQLWFGATRWKEVRRFDTPEEAREFYEAIKDLPEYLA